MFWVSSWNWYAEFLSFEHIFLTIILSHEKISDILSYSNLLFKGVDISHALSFTVVVIVASIPLAIGKRDIVSFLLIN
jgi:hypothetical protein